MAHMKGRPKAVWTGELAAGVEAGSADDDRICWHVVYTYAGQQHIAENLTRMSELESLDTPISDLPDEQQAEFWQIVTTYIQGWSNVTDATGSPVPFCLAEFLEMDMAHVGEIFAKLADIGPQIAAK